MLNLDEARRIAGARSDGDSFAKRERSRELFEEFWIAHADALLDELEAARKVVEAARSLGEPRE